MQLLEAQLSTIPNLLHLNCVLWKGWLRNHHVLTEGPKHHLPLTVGHMLNLSTDVCLWS